MYGIAGPDDVGLVWIRPDPGVLREILTALRQLS